MSLFKSAPAVSTDPALIAELLARGVEKIYPSREFLEKRLKSGERMTVYHGIDPTGPTLHLGHSVPLLKLAQFQNLGHKVILLIGDMTATIGDPTDKTAARTALTREGVLQNAKLYKKQASRLIKFSGENPAQLRHNSEWLAKLSLTDALQIYSNITYAQTIKRDMFQKRIAEGKDLYLHEFMYPMMQGYDSVAMDVDGEIGGSDQTFNMLVGRDLMKKLKSKEKFVVSMKLLTDAAGKKMGKTEGNMIAFSDSASEIVGKIMSWPDEMILSGFELCTRAPLSDIEETRRALEGGGNPRDAKLRLAEAVAGLLSGKEAAEKARRNFEAAFTEGKPEEFLEVTLDGRGVAEALIACRAAASKSELRRLIAEGAVTNLDTGEKAGEDFLTQTPTGRYRLGKHRFIRIR